MRITLSRILGAAFLLYAADGSQYEGPLYGIVRAIGIALLLSSVLFILMHHRALGNKDTLIFST